jgi:hypothetical protein
MAVQVRRDAAVKLFQSMEADGDGRLEVAELNAMLQNEQLYLPRETVIALHHKMVHATAFDRRTTETRFVDFIMDAKAVEGMEALKLAVRQGIQKQAGKLASIYCIGGTLLFVKEVAWVGITAAQKQPLYIVLSCFRCAGCIGFIDLLFDRCRAAFKDEVEAKLELRRELKKMVGPGQWRKKGWCLGILAKVDHGGGTDCVNAGELWQLFEYCGILTPVTVCTKIIHEISKATRKKIRKIDPNRTGGTKVLCCAVLCRAVL